MTGDSLDSITAQLSISSVAHGLASSNENSQASKQISDEQLLKSICSNDREALACLFQRYAKIAYGIGRTILRNETEADDLVQEVFLYIWRKCGVYDGTKGSAGSWIVQTIYYQAFQRRMRLAVHHHSVREIENTKTDTATSSTATEYDRSLEGMMGRAKLSEMLNSLTEDQWETLRLHFFEGYTLSEIARKKDQSLGNIRHHFYRGLEKLRSHIFRSELQDRITSGTR